MSNITFQIDQDRAGGTSYGTPGIARDDLYLARKILLHGVNVPPGATYYWELLYRPTGSTAEMRNPATDAVDHTCATPYFIPDVWGSYRVGLTVVAGGRTYRVILICATTYTSSGVLISRGWRYPAFGERAEEANFGGNALGSVPAINRIFDDIKFNSVGMTYNLLSGVAETSLDSATPQLIGAAYFDPAISVSASQDSKRVVKFRVLLETSDAGFTANVILYDRDGITGSVGFLPGTAISGKTNTTLQCFELDISSVLGTVAAAGTIECFMWLGAATTAQHATCTMANLYVNTEKL